MMAGYLVGADIVGIDERLLRRGAAGNLWVGWNKEHKIDLMSLNSLSNFSETLFSHL